MSKTTPLTYSLGGSSWEDNLIAYLPPVGHTIPSSQDISIRPLMASPKKQPWNSPLEGKGKKARSEAGRADSDPASTMPFKEPARRLGEMESPGLDTSAAPPFFVALIVEPAMIVDSRVPAMPAKP